LDIFVFFLAYVSSTLRKYFTFSGRASRLEFWYYLLFVWGFAWATMGIETLLRPMFGQVVSQVLALLNIALMGAFFSLFVRRLHDVNRSAWFMVWNLITGFLILLAIPFIPSDKGYNKFGAPPMIHRPTFWQAGVKAPKALNVEPDPKPRSESVPTVRRRRSY
jgi:uncharacterized membrane protein YhaH (DUF805 family)